MTTATLEQQLQSLETQQAALGDAINTLATNEQTLLSMLTDSNNTNQQLMVSNLAQAEQIKKLQDELSSSGTTISQAATDLLTSIASTQNSQLSVLDNAINVQIPAPTPIPASAAPAPNADTPSVTSAVDTNSPAT